MGKDMAGRGTAGSAGVQRAAGSLRDEAGGQAVVSSASAS